MIAILLFPPESGSADPWSPSTDTCQLPVVDRPILQHVLEALADQGVRTLHAVLPHFDGGREEFLGDGSRWGMKIQTWYGSGLTEEIMAVSMENPEMESQRLLLGPADSLPNLSELPARSSSHMIELDSHENSRNWYFLEGQYLGKFTRGAELDNLPRVQASSWLDSSTPEKLLRSQTAILTRQYPLTHLFAQEREPGVWIARNAIIHPSAKIISPVFIGTSAHIGREAVIGPNAVVSKRDIIGESTSIQNSLVGYHTAVGSHLHLHEAVLLGNVLHCTRNVTYLCIEDPVLAADI
jgi:NDP-sugar pyrophosphorylase family protein